MLDKHSISEADGVRLIAITGLALASSNYYRPAVKMLLRSKWWETLMDKTWIGGAVVEPLAMGFGFLLYMASMVTSTYFFMRDFHNIDTDHKALFSLIYGFYFVTWAMNLAVPFCVMAFKSMVPAFLLSFINLGIHITTFALLLKYSYRDEKLIASTSPAQWSLIFPVGWIAYITIILATMAYHTTYDVGYLKIADEEKGEYSQKIADNSVITNLAGVSRVEESVIKQSFPVVATRDQMTMQPANTNCQYHENLGGSTYTRKR